jgi:hypothetical protein
MKRFKWVMVLAAIFSFFLLMNCSDDKDNKNPNGPGNTTTGGSMTAKVAGSTTINFNATLAKAVVFETSYNLSGSQTVGTKTYAIVIQLTPPTMPPSGSYEIADMLASITENKALAVLNISENNEQVATYTSYSGTLTYTATSPKAKGTFSFNAREDVPGSPEITVTQGQFDVEKIITSGM